MEPEQGIFDFSSMCYTCKIPIRYQITTKNVNEILRRDLYFWKTVLKSGVIMDYVSHQIG